MKKFGATLLFATQVFAHSGVQSIVIDGITYPPWDVRIDSYLQDIKRIGWSYDVPISQALLNTNVNAHEYSPIMKMDSKDVACGMNPKAPALKATARAGANVTITWSEIIRMHRGPIVTWMGELPTPSTSINKVKFFKVEDKTYDPQADLWANEMAADNGGSHSFQIPSDIRPGTYVLRTEMIALHPNAVPISLGPLNGAETYPACFNVEVLSKGSATPVGSTFPGTYDSKDAGLAFVPYYGDGSGVKHNLNYKSPGPRLYQGQYDAPAGPPPEVKETGALSSSLQAKYEKLRLRMVDSNHRIVSQVNKAWPASKSFSPRVGYDYFKQQSSQEWIDAWADYNIVQTDVKAFNFEIKRDQKGKTL